MTLQEKIGQRLMTGFPGLEMSEEFRRAVREYKIGNVILFKENIVDCAQLKQLCSDIQDFVRQETGHSAFIAVDQEGGIVTRLKEDGVNIPGAMALGATGDPENAYKAAKLIGEELRALGPNFNFAPTVDVNCNPKNPVIGVRSYGDDPHSVAQFGVRAAQGFMDGGTLCCVKHFPGHGDTDQDSHLALPCVDKSMEQLEQMELIPFRAAVEAGVPAVMTSHILYPQIEPENVPATMSRRIMTGILREKLGFQGIIVSDGMEMAAIKANYGVCEGTLAAFRAGVDLVEITHGTLVACEAAQMILEAARNGGLDLEELDQSVQRILDAKEKWIENAEVCDFDFAAAAEESRKLLEQTVTQIAPRPADFKFSENPLCIGCEAYRTSLVGNVDEEKGNPFGLAAAEALQGTCADMTRDPSREEIEELVARAKIHGSAVVGTYNSVANPGQMALIRALVEANIPTAVAGLRAPYDLLDLPQGVWAFVVYENSRVSIQAAVKVLTGELIPTGKLPVKL